MSVAQTGFPGRLLIGLPSPGVGDAGFVPKVNATEDGYELDDPNNLVTPPSINVTTEGATFAITNTHLGGNQVVLASFAGDDDIDVPSGLTGTEPVIIVQYGVGKPTFVPGIGVTIRSADGNLAFRARYSGVTLIPLAADDYLLVGDLDA